MYRRSITKRFYLIIVGFLLVAVLSQTVTYSVNAKDHTIPSIETPTINTLENATFIMELNSSSLTRGEDDLVIIFQYTYETNDTYIPDSYIEMNITNPSVEVIYEDTIYMNETETGYYNKTISWSTFNGQDEGNYTVHAFANSTTTMMYNITDNFELNILPFGKLRMYFPAGSPDYLLREQNNNVPFIITNTGGTTAINVTVSNEIHKTGTLGSMTRSVSVSNIEINGGESFSDNIGFYPDGPLYQKHTFVLNYRTIEY